MDSIRLMNRTDTKFIATTYQLLEFLKAAQGQYYAQEIEGERVNPYHTVYLDTPDAAMYTAHHNGRLVRSKVRVRTYLLTGNTFFEIKNKNNHGRTKKKRIQVPDMEHMPQQETSEFLHQFTPYYLNDLRPTIENNFNRITLVNKEKTERLTIDFDLNFHHLITDERKDMGHLVVIELKRDGKVSSPAIGIFRDLRVHRASFSKYCIGSAYTNPGLKRNRFKTKLIKYNKLTQQ